MFQSPLYGKHYKKSIMEQEASELKELIVHLEKLKVNSPQNMFQSALVNEFKLYYQQKNTSSSKNPEDSKVEGKVYQVSILRDPSKSEKLIFQTQKTKVSPFQNEEQKEYTIFSFKIPEKEEILWVKSGFYYQEIHLKKIDSNTIIHLSQIDVPSLRKKLTGLSSEKAIKLMWQLIRKNSQSLKRKNREELQSLTSDIAKIPIKGKGKMYKSAVINELKLYSRSAQK